MKKWYKKACGVEANSLARGWLFLAFGWWLRMIAMRWYDEALDLSVRWELDVLYSVAPGGTLLSAACDCGICREVLTFTYISNGNRF